MGRTKRTPGSVIAPAAWKVPGLPQTRSPESRVPDGRTDSGPQAASGRRFLSPVPGALTAWKQEAKRRSRSARPPRGRRAGGQQAQGGTCLEPLWPGGPTRRNGPAGVLSYQQSGSPSCGESRSLPPDAPARAEGAGTLVEGVRPRHPLQRLGGRTDRGSGSRLSTRVDRPP